MRHYNPFLMAMPHLSPDVFPRSVVAVDSSPYKHREYEFGCKVGCYNCLLLILLKVQILLANFSNMHLWICWYQMIFCFYLKASAWLRLKICKVGDAAPQVLQTEMWYWYHYEKKLTKNIRPTNILQMYTKCSQIY